MFYLRLETKPKDRTLRVKWCAAEVPTEFESEESLKQFLDEFTEKNPHLDWRLTMLPKAMNKEELEEYLRRYIYG